MIFPPGSDEHGSECESAFEPKNELADIAFERRISVQRQAKKWFLILLVSGLVLGGIASFGVIQVLQKFGLTTKPEHPLRIEQPQN